MTRWERLATTRLPTYLGDWLGVAASVVQISEGTGEENGAADVVAVADDLRFIAEVRGTDDVSTLERALVQLARHRRRKRDVPLVVVPYMGPRARSWARDRALSWADLSGNAEIHAGGVHVHVAGRRNQYAHAGRPSNAFSPRFSRVTRVMLVEANRWWRQRDLVEKTKLPRGTVSKIVQRLSALGQLEHREDELRPSAPSKLLDAWAQRDEFDKHVVRRFHMIGRSGWEVLQTLGVRLSDADVTWAATGLAAAWLHTQFVDFRLTTLYVDDFPSEPEALGLHSVERGENVWLVAPRDPEVLYASSVHVSTPCVHPVQAYIDLQAHPERASEAAAHLRAQLVSWRA